MRRKSTRLGARWRIEEDFANGKDLGLDHYEVRSFLGWYRHSTLVMLALALLASITAAARQLVCSPVSAAVSQPLAGTPADLERLSVARWRCVMTVLSPYPL